MLTKSCAHSEGIVVRFFLFAIVLAGVLYGKPVLGNDSIPSSVIDSMADTQPDALQGLNESLDKRLSIFIEAWLHASQGEPVDNRAYLFALAIDLYNSIPADATPEMRELGPDEDAYEPNLLPIKQQYYNNHIAQIDGRGYKPESVELQKKLWDLMKEDVFRRFEEGSPNAEVHLKSHLETFYLNRYLREQIREGNIDLDDPRSSTHSRARNVDLFSPTYYPMLAKYRARIDPLIMNLVPTWQGEQILTANDAIPSRNEGSKAELNAAHADKSNQLTASASSEIEESPLASDGDWLLLSVAFLLLTLGSAVFFFRKRRK